MLRAVGYRLVHEVRDEDIVVVAIPVGRGDKTVVYVAANSRGDEPTADES